MKVEGGRTLDVLCRGYYDKYNKCGDSKGKDSDPFPFGGPGSPMDVSFADLCKKEGEKDINSCRILNGFGPVDDDTWLIYHGYKEPPPGSERLRKKKPK